MIAQGTPEWLEQRLGHVTASKVAVIMAKGKGRETYKKQIINQRLTGELEPSKCSDAMAFGTEQEPFARMMYEAHRKVLVEEVGFCAHPTIKWVGVSPDGLVEDGLLEIKVPNSETHLGYTLLGEAPANYIPQMQMQMWVVGKNWNDFCSYHPKVPKNVQLHIIRVYRDEEYIDRMEIEVVKFLAEVEESINQLEAK
jgi:putative phage-type endonuclease